MNWRKVRPNVALRLAGLVDGEGCFSIHAHPKGNYHCALTIRLRADDREMLEHYRSELGGIGSIRIQKRTNGWAPTVTWIISDKRGVGLIRDLFTEYPLWSKKQRDFLIWAEAVDFWQYSVGYRTDWSRVAELKQQLHSIREYVEIAA